MSLIFKMAAEKRCIVNYSCSLRWKFLEYTIICPDNHRNKKTNFMNSIVDAMTAVSTKYK